LGLNLSYEMDENGPENPMKKFFLAAIVAFAFIAPAKAENTPVCMNLWGGQAAAMAQSPQSWAEYKARMAANRCAELTSQQLALWAQQTAQQTAIAAHNAKVRADPCFGFKSAREALLGTITMYQQAMAKSLDSAATARGYQQYVANTMAQVADMDAAAARYGCQAETKAPVVPQKVDLIAEAQKPFEQPSPREKADPAAEAIKSGKMIIGSPGSGAPTPAPVQADPIAEASKKEQAAAPVQAAPHANHAPMSCNQLQFAINQYHIYITMLEKADETASWRVRSLDVKVIADYQADINLFVADMAHQGCR
jgi:hypothetical protein